MKISLNELNGNHALDFNYDVFKDDELDRRIIDLKNCQVNGSIYIDGASNTVLNCIFGGIMILEDSITLEEIPYEFSIEINEDLDTIEENYPGCIDNHKNTLDLKQILWQNIVLEVPISYSKYDEVNDAALKGEGWELLSEEGKHEEIDPRLKKLEELLERRD